MKNSNKFKATCLLTLTLITANPTKVYADNNNLNPYVNTVGEPEYAADLNRTLNRLPIGIRKYLSQGNLKIVLLDDPNGAEYMWQELYDYELNGIRGFTHVDHGKTTIYVEAGNHPDYYEKLPEISHNYEENEFNCMLDSDTLIHELGHFFDAEYNFKLSSSREFFKIFCEEADNYVKTTHYKVENLGADANIKTTVEYFATAYSCYIEHPEELQKYCPRTYEYIDNYMRKLNDEYTPKSTYDHIRVRRYTR